MTRCFLILTLLLAAFSGISWDFNGKDSRKTLVWKPAQGGRFAVTLAFRLTVPRISLTPGGLAGSAHYPMVMNAVKAKLKPGDFQKLLMCFVTKPNDRYAFVSASRGRYNIWWTNERSLFPMDKPIWVFLTAGSDDKLDGRIGKQQLSHTRSIQLLPEFYTAGEYVITLGCNPYRGGTGYMKCTITDFMIFERVLSVGEMEEIEKDPAKGKQIPGFAAFEEKE